MRTSASEFNTPPCNTSPYGTVLAPWRPDAGTANALAMNTEQQQAEERIFHCLLLKAQDAEASLTELFEFALALAHEGSQKPGHSAIARQLTERALAGKSDFDQQGNPLWISLPPQKKEDKEKQGASRKMSGSHMFFIFAACLAATCYIAALMSRLPKLF